MIMFSGPKRDKVRSVLLVIMTLLSIRAGSSAQVVQPEAHPNHYIVLVDASGSTSRPKSKAEAYQRALRFTVLDHLYRDGFGQTIPAVDPQQDAISLLNFGIVSGGTSPAYARLNDYSFLTDFVHPLITCEKGVSRSRLEEHILPTRHYEFTILSWAKQMAIWTLKPKSYAGVANRTFLIMASDEVSNQNSLQEEVAMVFRHAPDKAREAKQAVIDLFDRNYLFTDGRGERGWAFQEKFNEGDQPIFIEAYEVLPASWLEWEKGATTSTPVSDVKFYWKRSDGSEGGATAEINRAVLDELGIAKDAYRSLSLSIEGNSIDSQWNVGSPPDISVRISTEPTCDKKLYRFALGFPVIQSDEYLGTRTVQCVYSHSGQTPLPLRCTLWPTVWKIVWGLIGMAAVAAVTYFVYYRRFATHLQIELPGLPYRIRIQRRGTITGGTPISPKLGLEALRVRLQSGWLRSRWAQRMFYKDALLELITESDTDPKPRDLSSALHTSVPTWRVAAANSPTLKFPITEDQVTAAWIKIPLSSVQITVKFKQGAQESEIVLSYPKGVMETSGESS